MKTTRLLPLIWLCLATFMWSCQKEDETTPQNPTPEISEAEIQHLSIYFTNDMHGALANFAKIKHIVDLARDTTNVLLVSGGDIFSGSPIVDQYPEKGYPIIDAMNQTGYDISVIGNHEFDYGQEVLNARMEQAEFEWVCANVSKADGILVQPDAYKTLEIGDLKVTVLGLVETFGKPDDVIPATHPWRVTDLKFQMYWDVIHQYADLKNQEDADIYMALTHLGSSRDQYIANEFPYFDLIIGGHTNDLSTQPVNGIPVLMAGNKLTHLGMIQLSIHEKEVINQHVELINLAKYGFEDDGLAQVIREYQDAPEFKEEVGYATDYHNRIALGCFYTDALRSILNTDLSFQNSGGIRSNLDEGPITKLEVYEIDPFNNGAVVFTLTAGEIKSFFTETGTRLHVSGMEIIQTGSGIIFRDENGEEIPDNQEMTIGINDYIPAVYDRYFPLEKADIKDFTTAEAIVEYLQTINATVDNSNCNQFYDFR